MALSSDQQTVSFDLETSSGNLGSLANLLSSLGLSNIDSLLAQQSGNDLIPRTLPPSNLNTSPDREIALRIFTAERRFTEAFDTYLGRSGTSLKELEDIQEILRQIERETGVKPAVLYVVFFPPIIEVPTRLGAASQNHQAQLTKMLPTTLSASTTGQQTAQSLDLDLTPKPTDVLELLLVTGDSDPVQRVLPSVHREDVKRVAGQLIREVTDPSRRRLDRYLKPSQQLYDWLVAPMEANLQESEIENLVFVVDEGLRSLPLATLHNGRQFILERYSVSLMPSVSLTDTRHQNLAAVQVLAAGAEEFPGQGKANLPSVPVEVATISEQLWSGKSVLNRGFTFDTLNKTLDKQPFGLIHLATHADFRQGPADNSYIQFWDQKLPPERLRELGLGEEPIVELVTLSACRTAIGDPDAELGFAGLAVQTGAKSAMGSLWYVDDLGTMGLMTSFYEQLKQTPIKASALQQAQLSMLHGEVRVEAGAIVTPHGRYPLPPNLMDLEDQTLTHPFHWSAFTLIGSPW